MVYITIVMGKQSNSLTAALGGNGQFGHSHNEPGAASYCEGGTMVSEAKIGEAIPVVFGNMSKGEKAKAKKAQVAAQRELVGRHLPGCQLRLWLGGRSFGFLPEHARIYIIRDGEDLGYIGIRRLGRSPECYYERHRFCKGEDIYDVERVATIEDDQLIAAIKAAAAEWCERIGESFRMNDDDQFENSFGVLTAT